MVKDIEKLGAKLNRALFAWPREGYCLRNGKVEVCLSRTIYDPRSAVSQRCLEEFWSPRVRPLRMIPRQRLPRPCPAPWRRCRKPGTGAHDSTVLRGLLQAYNFSGALPAGVARVNNTFGNYGQGQNTVFF